MIVCNKCGNDSCTCDVSADTSHEVTSGLWIGGYRCNTHGFSTVCLCAEDDQKYDGGAVYVVKCPLVDAEPTLHDAHMATSAARFVAFSVSERMPTIVKCIGGLNRSGLVAGLALRMLGWHPDDAITRIRSARGALALSNKWFRKIVKEFDQL
jgi:protein-tyrosine phosphatase